MNLVTHWMSWEGGFDLVALTQPGLPTPNLVLHVARMVHTPVGSAPAGMVLIPGPTGAPELMGFISPSPAVAAYFGPRVFAGTPFEHAPVHRATINIHTASLPTSVAASVTIGALTVTATLDELGDLHRVVRPSAPMTPFEQLVLESAAQSATVHRNGQALPITIPPVGITGGPAAVWTATGIYAR